MNVATKTLFLEDLVDSARTLIRPGERRILGITGTPGAGKSTLCTALGEALGEDAAVVPMDGFHLANNELVRLGRRERKGAPDTFDVDGYANLLRRLREQPSNAIYAPRFDRALEESIGSAVLIPAGTPLIITEGNYLLYRELGWDRVRDILDEGWYVDISADLRSERLISRRQQYGDTAQDAAAWVDAVDEPNAAIIESTRDHADLIVHLTTTLP
ncbi:MULTISPECIES: nucleoside/nucleotide kinase family protein [unclassified Microbacterium]|uniref:nucleoside/nucleotide kinase family protein n=1 Tax=unclassified Microbacterium TaxID=2609290 RepID=UPI00366A416C